MAAPTPFPPPAPQNPCQPSPCGPNSQCQVSADGRPSCTCVVGYVGEPPGCRPECIINSECASHLACINQKCQDPCPGSCGASAECHVVVHIPNCVCPSGFTGDPFTLCIVAQCKLHSYLQQYLGSGVTSYTIQRVIVDEILVVEYCFFALYY